MPTSKPLSVLIPEISDIRLVNGIAYDSRSVERGFIFVAIEGYAVDGHDFIERAIGKGATCVVYDGRRSIDLLREQFQHVYFHIHENPRQALSAISARFFAEPTSDIHVVGVTGTNGKTTSTYLMHSIFKHVHGAAGLIGTIHNCIGDEIYEAERTTPESFELQSLFARMRERGIAHAVMEVSSHALFLNRCDDVQFNAILFTNITEDHLDFHATMHEYLEAKLKSFELVSKDEQKGAVFVNIHTDYLARVREQADSCGLPAITFGLSDEADYYARISRLDIKGTEYELFHHGERRAHVKLSLVGEFNVLNSLGVLAYTIHFGYDVSESAAYLEEVQVPGRFEMVSDVDTPFTVVVDYAHTDDALRNVLDAARKLKPKRIITVFGCGGDRDRKKRPLMGEAVGTLSDYAILTSDNPRTEDISQILDDTEPALKATGISYARIADRNEAIEHAIMQAQPGDLVLLAGKGHETYQVFRDETIHFDDREFAREVLSKRYH